MAPQQHKLWGSGSLIFERCDKVMWLGCSALRRPGHQSTCGGKKTQTLVMTLWQSCVRVHKYEDIILSPHPV